jgi:hypothetical protein
MSPLARSEQRPVATIRETLTRIIARWRGAAVLGVACLGVFSAPQLGLCEEPVPQGMKLRQIRPFTPTPSKSARELTANIAPSGKTLPPNVVDRGTLVINPGEDSRVVAANQQMMLCREPSGLNTRPLAFEDVPLERLGQRTRGASQPFVSAAKFFGVVPLVVPRGPERHYEATVGTTDPKYYGPVEPPTPYYVTVGDEPSGTSQTPTQTRTATTHAKPVELVDEGSEPRGIASKITTVAAHEPITGLEDVLPGFQSTVPAQPVAEPRYRTVMVDANGTEYVARTPAPVQPAPVRRLPQPPDVAPQVMPTNDTAASVVPNMPAQKPVYVWYPTKDGGLVPVARTNPQIAALPRQAAQPVAPPAAEPVAVPVQRAAPVERVYIVGQLPPRPMSTDDMPPALPVPPGPRTPTTVPQPQPQRQAPTALDSQASNNWDPSSSVCEGSFMEQACCETNCCKPYLGVEATFLSPQYSNNPITATAFDVTGNFAFQSNPTGTSYLGAAPRIWLGYGCENGRGVRGRFWQMNNSFFATDPLNFANPNDFTGFTTSSHFKAYTVDLEATRDFCLLNKNVLGFIGVRYAGLSMAESLYAQVLTRPVPDLLTAQATSVNQFYGTGLTWGLQCIDPIARNCCGDWDLFVSGRGSALFGTNSSAVASSAQVGGAGIFAVSNNQATADRTSTLMIGELQAGLQWSQCVKCCGNRRFFGRCAFEYQYWGVVDGVQTDTTSFAGRAPVDQIVITADRRNLSSINLIGISVAAGWYW